MADDNGGAGGEEALTGVEDCERGDGDKGELEHMSAGFDAGRHKGTHSATSNGPRVGRLAIVAMGSQHTLILESGPENHG